jgi:hypothetical protein
VNKELLSRDSHPSDVGLAFERLKFSRHNPSAPVISSSSVVFCKLSTVYQLDVYSF